MESWLEASPKTLAKGSEKKLFFFLYFEKLFQQILDNKSIERNVRGKKREIEACDKADLPRTGGRKEGYKKKACLSSEWRRGEGTKGLPHFILVRRRMNLPSGVQKLS